MSDRKLTLTVIALGLFAVTCGGSVVERDGEGGTTGAEAGAGGTAGMGGAGGVNTGGGVVGPGGQAGSHNKGGAAGAAAGGSGGYAGGVAGAGGSICPSPPPCNWCNGNPYYDPNGCLAGWTCANGVNPCVTQPCWQSGCPEGQACGSDGLCWAGVPTCSPKMCFGSDSSCECLWDCGPTKYRTLCNVMGSSINCECSENGSTTMACGGGAAGGGPKPSCDKSCCGFPEYEP